MAVVAVLATVAPAAAQLTRIGTNPILLATGMRGTDSAYDPANGVYLVVGAYGQTWGAFTTTSGDVLSTFQINGSGGFAHFARVAYSPHVSNGAGGTGGFLVTWHEGAGGDNFVRSRIVAYPNRLVTGITTIPSPATWWESGAAIAYSSSSQTFLSVFRTADYRIWGARINTSNGVVSSAQISPGNTFRDPNVAWNPHSNEFGVAYTGWGSSGASTTFTLLGAAGNVIRHNTFNFAGATYIGDLAFNVATNRYVAVWSQGPTQGAEISAAGDVLAAGLVSSTTGTYDGLGLSYNPVSGTFLLVGHGPSYDIWAAELNARGARTSGDTTVTSAGGPVGSFYPRASARTNAAQWNVTFAHNFASIRDQVVATSSSGGGPAGSLGTVSTPPPTDTGSTGGCPGTAPFPGAVCVNGGWVPGTTSGGDTGGSTGGCPGTAPFPGAVCVNGGWVAGTTSGGGTGGSTGGCPGTAPFPGAVCVNGGWVPGTTSSGGTGGSTGGCPGTAPFPGAVCVNGGWIPGTTSGGSGSTGGCTTPDPFAAIGGGTCVNGGWIPGSSGGSSSSSCATPSPGAGWTCVNGGWLPPSSTSSGGTTCTTPSPGTGWVCINGGWVPPDMAPASSTTSTSGGCTTPDPFVAMGGGVCINGGWTPRNSSEFP